VEHANASISSHKSMLAYLLVNALESLIYMAI
jgi:hypothetical protein